MSTQYITPIGLNYKKNGFYLEGGCLTVKNLRGLLTGDDRVGFRDNNFLNPC